MIVRLFSSLGSLSFLTWAANTTPVVRACGSCGANGATEACSETAQVTAVICLPINHCVFTERNAGARWGIAGITGAISCPAHCQKVIAETAITSAVSFSLEFGEHQNSADTVSAELADFKQVIVQTGEAVPVDGALPIAAFQNPPPPNIS